MHAATCKGHPREFHKTLSLLYAAGKGPTWSARLCSQPGHAADPPAGSLLLLSASVPAASSNSSITILGNTVYKYYIDYMQLMACTKLCKSHKNKPMGLNQTAKLELVY